MFAFAGLWASWRGVRGPKSAPVEGDHQLLGFLTTEANAIVAPIYPKAMPVILTTAAEVDLWLEADTGEALALEWPLPDDGLRIVAGEREDRAPRLRCDPHFPSRPAFEAMAGTLLVGSVTLSAISKGERLVWLGPRDAQGRSLSLIVYRS